MLEHPENPPWIRPWFCLMKSNPPTVTRSVSVKPDFMWYVHVTGRVVPRGNEVIQRLPAKVMSLSVLRDILSLIKAARTCPGNPEEHLVKILNNWLKMEFVELSPNPTHNCTGQFVCLCTPI